MIEVPLIPYHRKLVTVIDDIDSDLAGRHWKATPSKSGKPYVVTTITRSGHITYHRLSRIILARMVGRELTSVELVDHIDGNPLNNCRSNLRVCNGIQNRQNVPGKDSASGFKGVKLTSGGSWQAAINANHKHHYLGVFETAVAAARAYDAAALKYHGEFARTNVMLGLLPPLETDTDNGNGPRIEACMLSLSERQAIWDHFNTELKGKRKYGDIAEYLRSHKYHRGIVKYWIENNPSAQKDGAE